MVINGSMKRYTFRKAQEPVKTGGLKKPANVWMFLFNKTVAWVTVLP